MAFPLIAAAIAELGWPYVLAMLGLTAGTVAVTTSVVVPAVTYGITGNSYIGNYVGYYLSHLIDSVWTPVADLINSSVSVLGSFVDVFLALLSGTNVYFSYFMVGLLLIFFFSLVVKVILWIKQIVMRWL